MWVCTQPLGMEAMLSTWHASAAMTADSEPTRGAFVMTPTQVNSELTLLFSVNQGDPVSVT